MTNWYSWNFLVPKCSFLQCSVWKFSVPEFCFTENTWMELVMLDGVKEGSFLESFFLFTWQPLISVTMTIYRVLSII